MIARAVAVGLLVSGGAARAACVDVKIGDEQFFDCINREMTLYAGPRKQSALDAPGLHQSGPALGVFNQAAVRQRLGAAFGHSLVPQRSPTVFAPPRLGGR